MASNSTSTQYECPYRVDNFLLFEPFGCLLQPAHYALMFIWLVGYVYGFIDHTLTLIFKFNRKLEFGLFGFVDVFGYYAHLIGHSGFCLVVIIRPYASVDNSEEGTALWFFLWFASSGMMFALCAQTIFFTNIAVRTISMSGQINGDQVDRFFQFYKVAQIVLPSVLCATNLILWVILPYTLTNPSQQQQLVDGGAIAFGIAILIEGAITSMLLWWLRTAALKQIEFNSKLPGGGNDVSKLKDLAVRFLWSAIINIINSIFVTLFLIVVGAYTHTQWWFIHVIDGSAMIAIALVQFGQGGPAVWKILRGKLNSTSPDSSEIDSNKELQKPNQPRLSSSELLNSS